MGLEEFERAASAFKRSWWGNEARARKVCNTRPQTAKGVMQPHCAEHMVGAVAMLALATVVQGLLLSRAVTMSAGQL